jgi:formate-dependent nitrite reductase cytochrome c552 subunit
VCLCSPPLWAGRPIVSLRAAGCRLEVYVGQVAMLNSESEMCQDRKAPMQANVSTPVKELVAATVRCFGQQQIMLHQMTRYIEEMCTKGQARKVISIVDSEVAEAHSQLDDKVAEAHFQLENKLAEAQSQLRNKFDRARHDINRAITRLEDLVSPNREKETPYPKASGANLKSGG